MRAYWVKIILGMLLVFAVGFPIVSAIKSARNKVNVTLNSSDPITIPLPFVPFRVDGQKFGDLDRLTFLRDDPKHISGVHVVVKLADSAVASKLKNCTLAVVDVEHLDEKSTFLCNADSAGLRLVPFGEVQVKGQSGSYPLLLPSEAVKGLRQADIGVRHGRVQVDSRDDSLGQALEAMADSIDQAQERMSDSLERVTDSISQAASNRADSIIQARSRIADSVRQDAIRKADSIRALRQQ